MKLYTYLLFCASLFMIGCKGESKPLPSQEKTTIAEEDFNPLKRERVEELKKRKTEPNMSEISSMRQQALSIINHRLKNGAKSYAIIEADTWEYEFYFKGEMSKPGEYDGVWIDFKPDHTYAYGNKDNVQGEGRYNYQFERQELLMVDNVNNQKPQEWQVKSGGDVLILVGTNTFKDNAVQMKLVRVDDDIQAKG